MTDISLDEDDKFERRELIQILRNTTHIIGVEANDLVGEEETIIDYSIDIHVDNHNLPTIKITKEYYLTAKDVLYGGYDEQQEEPSEEK